MMKEYDVLIIGGGPGGLAAACAAKKEGAQKVIVLEREKKPGGILNQCIHDGFGLIRYKSALTGPEYAERAITEANEARTEILTSRHVSDIRKSDLGGYDVFAYTTDGIESYHTKTIILATGCRERTRGNISIPGSRPAGIYTAGVAQNLVNVRNVMIGKRVVILGSGDIGLIMARRLTLEGARVLAIAEIMSEPTGLARNVSQCVYEFDIPLYVRTTISKVIGKRKLEAVELSDLDEYGKVIPGTAKRIECDALVLSVGLIPENEVAQTIGVNLMPNNSVETDMNLQTNVHGIFSCGNSRHVMDLADYVSEQGEMAGKNAVHLIRGEQMEVWDEEKSNCMKKGFPDVGTVTCTICPNGCQVKWDDAKNTFIGNNCKHGADFAEQEKTDPRRTVTSTVRVRGLDLSNDKLISVRTDKPVKKDDVIKVANEIRGLSVHSRIELNTKIGTISMNGENIGILSTMIV